MSNRTYCKRKPRRKMKYLSSTLAMLVAPSPSTYTISAQEALPVYNDSKNFAPVSSKQLERRGAGAGYGYDPYSSPTVEQHQRDLIIGGTKLGRDERPYLVSVGNGEFIEGKRAKHKCGATLIAPNTVLTAAHCYTDEGEWVPNDWVDIKRYNLKTDDMADLERVELCSNEGGTGCDLDAVGYVIRHPTYGKAVPTDNNFALIFLPDAITDIEPVALNDDPDIPQPGDGVKILGWGLTNFEPRGKTNYPHIATTTYIGDEELCTNEPYIFRRPRNISSNMLCTYDEEHATCAGDSGGPYVIDTPNGPVQVGVDNFGDPIPPPIVRPPKDGCPDLQCLAVDGDCGRSLPDDCDGDPCEANPCTDPDDKCTPNYCHSCSRICAPGFGYNYLGSTAGTDGTVCEVGSFVDPYDACGADAFCLLDEGVCNVNKTATHGGVCRTRPIYCSNVFEPVCGCDGVTYHNECVAHSNRASVSSWGECPEECNIENNPKVAARVSAQVGWIRETACEEVGDLCDTPTPCICEDEPVYYVSATYEGPDHGCERSCEASSACTSSGILPDFCMNDFASIQECCDANPEDTWCEVNSSECGLRAPTGTPSKAPSKQPTNSPATQQPSSSPLPNGITTSPTGTPSKAPSKKPTDSPASQQPSSSPVSNGIPVSPTLHPTPNPIHNSSKSAKLTKHAKTSCKEMNSKKKCKKSKIPCSWDRVRKSCGDVAGAEGLSKKDSGVKEVIAAKKTPSSGGTTNEKASWLLLPVLLMWFQME